MSAVSVTSKGQVTIPKRIRQALGIKTGSKVEFAVAGNEARLKVAHKRATTRVEDGAGMLKYRGPRISIADMDVAKASISRIRCTQRRAAEASSC